VGEPLPIEGGPIIPAEDLSYEFSRSGGPGGQHVNTTDTRVRLRFALATCSVLSDDLKARLRASHPAWLTAEGDIILTSDRSRSRHQNLEDVRARLAEAIRAALIPPKKRQRTRPSRASRRRRLADKKRRGTVKAGRKPPKSED